MADGASAVGREPPDPPRQKRLARMLEARSIAVVGASERPGSFGLRLATEVLRSPSAPAVHLVHPRHRSVLGRRCVPSLADVADPVDLVVLGVPDAALVAQVSLAARRGDGGAVVFGTAAGLGEPLSAAAGAMALCGAGCMGFVNVARGVRAIGYVERDPIPAGGIALVTHSGSVFSALLRTHRRLEYSLAVSSGQELLSTAADFASYALTLPETRVVGLFLETLRDVPAFRSVLAEAAARDIAVVALTVGSSLKGRSLVEAHSGALAGDDAAWEALFAAYGVHRVAGLEELVDTLETFSIGRRVPGSVGRGLATVHDSGAERVLVADVAQQVGVSFADISEVTRARLAAVLGPGLEPVNPLDLWSTGTGTEALVTACLQALADDPSVGAVALAVDLVPEYDGDESYPGAVEAVLRRTEKPVVVLSNVAAAVDQPTAARLRRHGVPVLEGTRSGLVALGHLLAGRPEVRPAVLVDGERRGRWLRRLGEGPLDLATSLELLADYSLRTAPARRAATASGAVAAAAELGFPVVLKTDIAGIAHKAVVGGVALGLGDAPAVAAAYDDITGRLGAGATVQRQLPGGVELHLGVVRDPLVGPLVVVAAGGTLVELLHERRVALPPVSESAARLMLSGLRVWGLLTGADLGDPSGGVDAVAVDAVAVDEVVDAVLAMSRLALELGEGLEALDVNPLIVTRDGAVAVDALVVPLTSRPKTGRRAPRSDS